MTNDEIKREMDQIRASLAEQERRTDDLEHRVTILEGKVETAKGWRIVWPQPKGGDRDK